jgi:Pyrimidine dimer DNA glycosylase
VNIFVTSPDPRACALALDDLRLNKMIVESCQILCTVLHLSGLGSPELYKPAYIRHPVVLWTARDARHYAWLVHHLEALFDERAFRFGSSEHRSLRLLPFLTQYVENLMAPEVFVNCTPYKNVPSIYLAYQMTLKPGFPGWIGPTGPKAAETLAELPVPSFTRRVRRNSAT